ncbi:hypothetical protein [Enterovibrio norvegicus]|uniref:Transcriptional regulator n=1 Tax=Enterovibrio norvegicus TaxID=188144 RepID=A0ABV4L940_9GAMM
MKEYMVIARIVDGENQSFIVEGESFDAAAEKGARLVLDQEQGDRDAEIFVDVVVDRNFEHKSNFHFEASGLR